ERGGDGRGPGAPPAGAQGIARPARAGRGRHRRLVRTGPGLRPAPGPVGVPGLRRGAQGRGRRATRRRLDGRPVAGEPGRDRRAGDSPCRRDRRGGPRRPSVVGAGEQRRDRGAVPAGLAGDQPVPRAAGDRVGRPARRDPGVPAAAGQPQRPRRWPDRQRHLRARQPRGAVPRRLRRRPVRQGGAERRPAPGSGSARCRRVGGAHRRHRHADVGEGGRRRRARDRDRAGRRCGRLPHRVPPVHGRERADGARQQDHARRLRRDGGDGADRTPATDPVRRGPGRRGGRAPRPHRTRQDAGPAVPRRGFRQPGRPRRPTV
ncbi:MAG: Short-chain dehydrogenase/reductase SDR, partial [uncultured Corynebacteriales bacterium]